MIVSNILLLHFKYEKVIKSICTHHFKPVASNHQQIIHEISIVKVQCLVWQVLPLLGIGYSFTSPLLVL